MDFEAAMDDDLNTSEALSVVYDLIRDINRSAESGTLSERNARQVLAQLVEFGTVLGVILFREVELTFKQQELIQERQRARERHDWARADEIRQELEGLGLTLIDKKFGSIVKR